MYQNVSPCKLRNRLEKEKNEMIGNGVNMGHVKI